MTELRHLQLVILEIIRDIDFFCQQYGIDYYLLGGSALGAIRHQGFIPWDDDLDICMNSANYKKFVQLAKEKLDPEKYYVQEGLVDWPLNFSKVKLKGTHLSESECNADLTGEDGIFIDIFKLENAPSKKHLQLMQYILAKYYLCYQLAERGFYHADFKKKLMMALSSPLKIKWLRNIVKGRIEKYSDQSEYYGSFYFRTRSKNAFTKKEIFGLPSRKPFEDMMLPVPENYHEYLTQIFGDYMTPPPPEQRVGLHMLNVDFGKY